MIGHYLEQALGVLALAVLFAAVMWELDHLVGWIGVLTQGGPVDHLLRSHAYDYVTWFFGTDFGWHC